LNVYSYLVNGYFQILGHFPPALAWLVSLAVLIAFVTLFLSLVRANLWFLILLAIFLPVVIPIIVRLLTDAFMFFVFLVRQLGVKV
jgi:hypothetical protein